MAKKRSIAENDRRLAALYAREAAEKLGTVQEPAADIATTLRMAANRAAGFATPASEKQIAYLASLLKANPAYADGLFINTNDLLTSKKASFLIDDLKRLAAK